MRRIVSLAFFATFALACSDDPDPPMADSGIISPRDVGVTDGGANPDATVNEDAETNGDAETNEDATVADGGDASVVPDEWLIPGLSASTTVDYDEHGIPHIRCATNDDCFAVQGYLHAAHRFGEMDLRRRFVRGRLSEVFGLFGDAVLQLDRRSRLFIATREGGRLEERMWQSADADTQAAITAYTRGVNAWLVDLRAGKNGARITAEWPLSIGLAADWDVLDSAACMLGLLEDLTNNSDTELDLGALAATLQPAEFFDLFGFLPASQAIILNPVPEASRSGPLPVLGAIDSARPRLSEVRALLTEALGGRDGARKSEGGFGSNNWIVSPSQSANGKALLANDPHLGLDNPPVWYINSMTTTAGDLDVGGVSFVGVPGIILGHNANIAWGATTTFYDMADVYVEELSGANATVLNGNPVPMNAVPTTIQRLGFPAHTETFYYVPHHGPVVSVDAANGRAISIHWVGHEADTDLNFIMQMMKATNMAEAKLALRNLTSTGQNFVVADVDGSIGWFPYSRVPQRPWATTYPPFLPLPGTGEAEWAGYINYDELPQSENPPAGYLATANGDMLGNLQDGDPLNDATYIQHDVADGYRQQRILERLADGAPALDRASMQDIQSDVHLSIAEDVVPVVLQLAATSSSVNADGMVVRDKLASWSYECATGLTGIEPDSAFDLDEGVSADSIGCMAFHAMLGRLNRAVFDDEIAMAGLNRRARIDSLVTLLTRPGLLANGSAYWDDLNSKRVEVPEEIVGNVLNSTADYLNAQFPGGSNNWRWGVKHTLTLSAAFASVDIGPYANDGGYSTVDVAQPDGLHSDNYAHSSGASMRLACDLNRADGVNCSIELPGGQRTFENSPHYSDLFLKWLVNEPYELWFSDAEVDTNSVEKIEFNAP
jgi:penicillin amidase